MFLLPCAPLDNTIDLEIPPLALAMLRILHVKFVEIPTFLDARLEVLGRGLNAIFGSAFVGGEVADAQGEGVFVVRVLAGAVVVEGCAGGGGGG